MSLIEDKLITLRHQLAAPKQPVGNDAGCKRAGDPLFVSGRVSELRGVAGACISDEEAKLAARDTMLLLLAIVKAEIHALDLILGVLKVHGYSFFLQILATTVCVGRRIRSYSRPIWRKGPACANCDRRIAISFWRLYSN